MRRPALANELRMASAFLAENRELSLPIRVRNPSYSLSSFWLAAAGRSFQMIAKTTIT